MKVSRSLRNMKVSTAHHSKLKDWAWRMYLVLKARTNDMRHFFDALSAFKA